MNDPKSPRAEPASFATETSVPSSHRRLRIPRNEALKLAIRGKYGEAGALLAGALEQAGRGSGSFDTAERQLAFVAATYFCKAEQYEAAAKIYQSAGEEQLAEETRALAPGATPAGSRSPTPSSDPSAGAPSNASTSQNRVEQLEQVALSTLEHALSETADGRACAERAQSLAKRARFADAAPPEEVAWFDSLRANREGHQMMVEAREVNRRVAAAQSETAEELASMATSSPPDESSPWDDASRDSEPSSEVRSPFFVGTTIGGRYRLDAVLGCGGMSTVYRATDLELDEVVALKVFRRSLIDEDGQHETLDRFRHELKLSRQLRHPNVIRLYDIGAVDEHRYISMELLEGRPLASLVAERLPLGRILKLLAGACRGLQAAHDQGVVHRDVKPENLFVVEPDILKVMDFGIAKSQLVTGLTMLGTFGGTPAYMAPEQISDFSGVGPAADQYALGIVAYELLSGERPFDHPELMPLLMLHAQEEPRPLRGLVPAIPREIEEAVLRMLRKKPAERFASCAEVAERLEAIAEKLTADTGR